MATYYTDDELTEYAATFALVHADAIDHQDEHGVTEAGQLISSGAGLYNLFPPRLADPLLQAIETGYGQALRDTREGQISGLGEIE